MVDTVSAKAGLHLMKGLDARRLSSRIHLNYPKSGIREDHKERGKQKYEPQSCSNGEEHREPSENEDEIQEISEVVPE